MEWVNFFFSCIFVFLLLKTLFSINNDTRVLLKLYLQSFLYAQQPCTAAASFQLSQRCWQLFLITILKVLYINYNRYL